MFNEMRDKTLEDAIQTLTVRAYTNSERNGFWEHFPGRFGDERIWIGEKIALAHTELSEALDHSRKKFDPADRYASIIGELGDTIWRCFDMAYVINQFDALHPDDMLGPRMIMQMNNMHLRGRMHGKRW